jgi:branched-chain amino acid transport system permease protein
VVLLQDQLTGTGLLGWQPVILGAVLILMVLVAPDGIYVRLRSLLPVSKKSTPPPAAREPIPSDVDGEPAEVDETAPEIVECRGLTRHFGGVHAVEDLTLSIREGELVGLVGPNGSGKTTLVNLLTGGLRPTRGQIHIAGRNTTGLPPHRITHAGVARTYQIPRPFASMSVRDNVAMAVLFGHQPRPLPEARRIAARHLAVVGLDHLADARPAALNLHQRQLLEIARALATSPRLLLLDEALAGLNPAEIDNAVEVIRRIHASGVTIVIVEHLLRVVKALATRVIVLDRGTLLADGDPAAVLADPAVVRAYLGKRAHA